MTNINKITRKQRISRVLCQMCGRGQTVPSSHAPVHAPSHTPPCPPLVRPLQPPPLCPPHSVCPFGRVQRAPGIKGVCTQPPMLPRRLVCAPPVGVPLQPSPLRPPLFPPSSW